MRAKNSTLFNVKPTESCAKFVGYVRVSTSAQADLGDSIEAQRGAILEWARRSGAEIVEIYVDAGISGSKSRAKRPGYDQALGALESGLACGIVATSIDRLSRESAYNVAQTICELVDAGYRIVALDWPGGGVVDTSSPGARLQLDMLAAFASFFRAQVAEKTRLTLRSKAQRGEKVGHVPFGKVEVEGKLIDDVSEMKILKQILKARSAGQSLGAIADSLNQRGIKPRRATNWSKASVDYVIKSHS